MLLFGSSVDDLSRLPSTSTAAPPLADTPGATAPVPAPAPATSVAGRCRIAYEAR